MSKSDNIPGKKYENLWRVCPTCGGNKVTVTNAGVERRCRTCKGKGYVPR